MSSVPKLTVGDPAPWFRQASFANPDYAFDTVAGRYLVLCFFGSGADPHAQAAISGALARRDLFDDVKASFFGVSQDASDKTQGRMVEVYPGYRFFWDFDFKVGQLYGVTDPDPNDSSRRIIRRCWIVLDPTLRIINITPFRPDRSEIPAVIDFLSGLPAPTHFTGSEVHAPILVLPNVFEPAFCRHLVQLYESHGGEVSGFMREVDGKTIAMHDDSHKKRRDYVIEDPAIIKAAQQRVQRRINPEILKVHNFKATRMERYIVACYAAEDHAHFRAHRDNTSKGTAHRRFAVSINLNDDFDGGEVSFPEYGPRSYKAPIGGAVVFSCGLLHAVSQVVRGRRYAFLPFLYDEEAAKLREANNRHLGEGLEPYKAFT